MKSKSTQILWITDPWETLDHPKDTTLRLVEECLKLGAACFWASPRMITLEDNRTRIQARELRDLGKTRIKEEIFWGNPTLYGVADFQQIYYRTDPPVDAHYLHPLFLLARATPHGRPVIHAPLSLLFSNSEKIIPPELEDYAPRSKVATTWDDFQGYGKKLGQTVLKPLHMAQSQGVELLDWKSTEGVQRARAALEGLTEKFTRPAMLQEFLPGIAKGETRIWYIDGRFLACARKLPAPGQFRIDMDHGGALAPHTLDDREKKASLAIGRWLSKNAVRLAAVDLIDGKITDLNFTSPGLIVGMEQVTSRNLAREIALQICGARSR